MEQLLDAIDRADMKTLRRAAHTVKGAMRTFACGGAIEISGRLEDMGRREQIDGAEELYIALKRELDGLLPEVSAYVRSADLPKNS